MYNLINGNINSIKKSFSRQTKIFYIQNIHIHIMQPWNHFVIFVIKSLFWTFVLILQLLSLPMKTNFTFYILKSWYIFISLILARCLHDSFSFINLLVSSMLLSWKTFRLGNDLLPLWHYLFFLSRRFFKKHIKGTQQAIFTAKYLSVHGNQTYRKILKNKSHLNIGDRY